MPHGSNSTTVKAEFWHTRSPMCSNYQTHHKPVTMTEQGVGVPLLCYGTSLQTGGSRTGVCVCVCVGGIDEHKQWLFTLIWTTPALLERILGEKKKERKYTRRHTSQLILGRWGFSHKKLKYTKWKEVYWGSTSSEVYCVHQCKWTPQYLSKMIKRKPRGWVAGGFDQIGPQKPQEK